MKIEKLNENKIRITLSLDDLAEKHIDVHTFMSNSIESQKIFLDMLAEAEKKVGFVTDNYRIMLEALALSDGSFILTVTKMEPETEKERTKYKPVHIRRKTPSFNHKLAIYLFSSFEEFCSFCHIFSNELDEDLRRICRKCSLYLYDQKYYLVFQNIDVSSSFSRSFFHQMIEYATPVSHPQLLKGKLEEYGKPIMKSNAIHTCLKYF